MTALTDPPTIRSGGYCPSGPVSLAGSVRYIMDTGEIREQIAIPMDRYGSRVEIRGDSLANGVVICRISDSGRVYRDGYTADDVSRRIGAYYEALTRVQ